MSKDEVIRGLRIMVGFHQEKPELWQDYDYKVDSLFRPDEKDG